MKCLISESLNQNCLDSPSIFKRIGYKASVVSLAKLINHTVVCLRLELPAFQVLLNGVRLWKPLSRLV